MFQVDSIKPIKSLIFLLLTHAKRTTSEKIKKLEPFFNYYIYKSSDLLTPPCGILPIYG